MYETKAAANRQLPITFLILACKNLTFSPHLLFSPARPLTSFSADVNFAKHQLASASTFIFIIVASSNCLFKLFTFSVSTRTLSFTTANSFFLVSTVSVACFTCSTNGCTSLKILLNFTMLAAHPHNLLAAKDYEAMSDSVNFLLGSSVTVFTGFNLSQSMFLPSKFRIRSMNCAGLFMTP